MYYSFIDPTKLSDNEIYDTISKLQQRIGHAQMYGQHQMVRELELYIQTLITEQQDRVYKRSLEKDEVEMKRHPNLKPRFGTTPITLGEIEGEKNNNNKNDNEK